MLSAMASTTLMTFLVEAPRSIAIVKLLGSWDNFTKPYPMRRDARKGHGHWRGCHSFTDIICDGDSYVAPNKGRDGALKMGGTYWYYYELDGHIEHYNPAEPSTTLCPFLPGQVVNILEVPTLVHDVVSYSSNDSSGPILSTYHYTLNPEDKYLTCKQPVETTRFEGNVSALLEDDHLIGRDPEWADPCILEATDKEDAKAHPRSSVADLCCDVPSRNLHGFVSRSEPTSSNASIWTTWDQLRSIFSAGNASLYEVNNERTLEWLSSLKKPDGDAFSTYSFQEEAEDAPLYTEVLAEAPSMQQDNPSLQTQPANRRDENSDLSERRLMQSADRDPQDSEVSQPDIKDCSAESGQPTPVQPKNIIIEDDVSNLRSPPPDQEEVENDTLDLPIHATEARNPSPNPAYLSIDPIGADHEKPHRYSSLYSSVRSSQVLSPSLTYSTALTGYMSPMYLGEPITPQFADFDTSFLDFTFAAEEPVPPGEEPRKVSSIASHGFAGYGLSEAEQASALTLCNLQTKTPKSANHHVSTGKRTGRDLVTNWMANSTAQQEEGLDDILDDLAYLGGVIV